MRNEDTNESPVCTVCGTEEFGDCGHLVADLDITFSECEGGALYERLFDFTTALEIVFAANRSQDFQSNFGFYARILGGLWHEVQDDAAGGPENIVVTGPIFLKLLIELLRDAGADEYQGPVIIDGGPGNSTSCMLYFSKNPETTIQEAYRSSCRGDLARRRRHPQRGSSGGRR